MSDVTDYPIRSKARPRIKDFHGARFFARVYLGVATVILLVVAFSAAITYAQMHRHGAVWWFGAVIVVCILLGAIFLAAVAFDDIPESVMPTSDDIEALLDALMYGALDDHLERIATIVKIRQGMIAGVNELVARSQFHPGDRVRFVDSVKPRYLIGCAGVITRMEMERCVVQLDEPVGRYTSGEVKARATQLEPIRPE